MTAFSSNLYSYSCYGPSYRDWEMDIEETYEEWDAAFYVLEKNAEVFITEPALVFKLLRNFGHMIRNIGINFRIMNVKCCAEIENYLSKYCSESLRRLSLGFHRLRIPFEYLQKPLKSVTHLKIVIGYTEKHHIRFLDRNNLPNVSHVFILNNCRDLCDDETEANFENIDYFSMYTGYSLERFPFLFGNLKYLALFGSIHINDDILGNIERLETLKIFKLSTKSCRDSYNKLLGLKNIQSNLEEMRLGFEEHIYADDIHRFLKQSQMLRRLRLTYDLLYYRHSFPNIIRTITSNLDECWKFHVDYKYKNPYANSVKEYKTLLIDRKID